MIASWTVKSFKSIYERTQLEIAPLTVFAGINSSGKSTVLQSILLVAQSLQSPVRPRAITLNGRVLRLGTYADVLSSGGTSAQIDIAFRLCALDPSKANPRVTYPRSRSLYWRGNAEEIEAISCAVSFSASEINERKQIVQLHPSLESCFLETEYKAIVGETLKIAKTSIQINRNVTQPEAQMVQLSLSKLSPEDLSALEFKPSVHVDREVSAETVAQSTSIGVSRFHFLPRALLVRYDEITEQARLIVRAYLSPSDTTARRAVSDAVMAELPSEFKTLVVQCVSEAMEDLEGVSEFSNRSLQSSFESVEEQPTPQNLQRLANWLPPRRRTLLYQLLGENSARLENLARRGRGVSYKTRFEGLPWTLDFAADYIGNYFTFNVKYLAPLRDEPKPVYPLSGNSDPDDIGFHGEHTAAVLELNKTRDIQFVPSSKLEAALSEGYLEQGTLESAVLDWLVYMGVVRGFSTGDLGKLGHELKVSTGTALRDLTHVGVGVSQVLPIIVQCLIAEPGSTLIFEQPELHLHPSVQSRLADFFLSMTVLGKQCIVETHSEHLVNKLRLRTVQAREDRVSSKIAMYFVESEGERSRYMPIEMNSYGAIKNWPKGFFDEGEQLAAAIIQASIEKRSRERKEK